MKSEIATIFFILQTVWIFASAPVVENVRMSQRIDGSLLVDIYYDVYDEEDDWLNVTVQVSNDNGITWNVSCDHMSGDIGPWMYSDTEKHIVWEFHKDCPNTYGNQYKARVTADNDMFQLEIPVLISPEDGTITENPMPAFEWDDVDGATGYELVIFIGQDDDYPYIWEQNLTETCYTPSAPLPWGTYYWSVRAYNAQGQWSDWSDDWYLTIGEIPDYGQLIVGGWHAEYEEVNYSVTSEFIFTEDGEITSYTVFEPKNVWVNYHASRYEGTYQIVEEYGNYFFSYHYTDWQIVPDSAPITSGSYPFRFDEENQLELYTKTGYGDQWITYTRAM